MGSEFAPVSAVPAMRKACFSFMPWRRGESWTTILGKHRRIVSGLKDVMASTDTTPGSADNGTIDFQF